MSSKPVMELESTRDTEIFIDSPVTSGKTVGGIGASGTVKTESVTETLLVAIVVPDSAVTVYVPLAPNKTEAILPLVFSCVLALGLTLQFTVLPAAVCGRVNRTGSPFLIELVLDASRVGLPVSVESFLQAEIQMVNRKPEISTADLFMV